MQHFFNNIVKQNDKVLEESLKFALSPSFGNMSYSNREALYASIGRAYVIQEKFKQSVNTSYFIVGSDSDANN